MTDHAAAPARPASPAYIDRSIPAQEAMLEREFRHVSSNRDRSGREDKPLTGIALSGGGIRSAIFCLGALQALASRNVLPNFDYMSSVSGGGYIHAALQWFWHSDPNADSSGNFPFGTAKQQRSDVGENPNLKFLRAHGRYLTPGDGLSIWTLTAVILRTIFLNLMVWIPLGALVFILVIAAFHQAPDWLKLHTPNLLWFAMAAEWQDHRGLHWPLELFFAVCLLAGLLLIAWSALWALGFSLDTRISPKGQSSSGPKRPLGILLIMTAAVIFSVIVAANIGDAGPMQLTVLFVLVIIAAMTLFVTAMRRPGRAAAANYKSRRRFERWAGYSLPWTTIILALGTVPLIPWFAVNEQTGFFKAAVGLIGTASGAVTGIVGHQAQSQKKAPGDGTRWMLMAASAVFLYFVAVLAYSIAQLAFDPAPLFGASYQNVVPAVVFAAGVLAVILALGTNVNYVGLHRFYRDRLMEGFMPNPDSVERDRVGPSEAADRLSIMDLWPPRKASADDPNRAIPYPIVNTNAILVNDRNRKRAWRGGDNFIISPLYIGSTATGWEKTPQHITKYGPQTLASAVAASGAALNANAAYAGAGVTRDRLLSIVMVLMNLRLGMWVGRPTQRRAGRISRQPNHFIPGFLYGMALGGYRSESAFQELSDGGHFDNLGIYELIRRRLAVIFVVDGEEDNTTAMAALFSAAQRVREDFDVTIDLRNGLDDLVPAAPNAAATYPLGAKYVREPYFEAPIIYPGGAPGRLIYVKLSLVQDVGFEAKGYRAQHPDFPHQSTSDQFFRPEQIEAYRTLGYYNMEMALDRRGIDATSF
jgi:Patatin-like phospholipase